MKSYSVNLKEAYPFLQGGKLDCLAIDYPYDGTNTVGWKRPALIVVPGGAYGMVSKREAETVAVSFLDRGFQAFVLNYLCEPQNARYPEQLLEAASAVDYVRKHAEELDVNPEEVFLVGFSAGGHLTGNLAVEHQNIEKKAGVTLDCKPTAVGLCYPVISKVCGHKGSYDNLLKGYSEEEKAEIYKWVSLEDAVSEQTPPAFLWSTAEDTVVPPENAIRYALALGKQGIPYELHVYPRIQHGASTGNQENNAYHPDLKRISRWVDDCTEFFRLQIVEKF